MDHWNSFVRPGFAKRVVLAVLLAGIGAFHLVTLREGFSWFGDAPSYIQHAENIVEGRPYARSGYIQNPHHFLAPKAYPPGYPLLMAPVIAAFGTDVDALRVEGILVLVAVLLVTAYMFRRNLSFLGRCSLIAVVGLHPFFWEMSQRLTPDVLFLLVAYVSLTAYAEAQRGEKSAGRKLPWELVAGFSVCYAITTRTIGIVLLPGLLICDLIRFRRPTRAFLVVLGLCLALFGGGVLFFSIQPPGGGYASLVQHNIVGRLSKAISGLPAMFVQYVRYADQLWDNGYSRVLMHGLFLAAAVPVLVGFGHRLWRRFSVFEAFSVFYLAALLPWTFDKMRYFIPLIPLYYFYLFTGLELLQRRIGLGRIGLGRIGLRKETLTGAALILILGTCAARYTTMDFEPIRPTFTGPQAIDFYEQVRRHTDAQEVLVAQFPRQVAFFTDRSASVPHRRWSEERFFRYAQQIGAQHLVVGPPERPWENIEYSLEEVVRRHPDRFAPVYGNEVFQLYRISAPESSRGSFFGGPLPGDSTEAR